MSAVELHADVWGSEPMSLREAAGRDMKMLKDYADAHGDSFPTTGNIACERCQTTHNLHGDCRPRTEQLPGQPKFNSLHISHLPLKVDGRTEHLFVAILNGEAVGQVLALKQEWGACGLRMLYVAQKHRFMGIGSRLVSRVQVFAHKEQCNAIEIAVHKSNQEGRKFWIHKRFIDAEDGPERGLSPEYRCMVREI